MMYFYYHSEGQSNGLLGVFVSHDKTESFIDPLLGIWSDRQEILILMDKKLPLMRNVIPSRCIQFRNPVCPL